jgi:WD40 repeat protein
MMPDLLNGHIGLFQRGRVAFRSLTTGDVVASMRSHVGSVDGIGWAFGDRYLISASQHDGIVLLWDVP